MADLMGVRIEVSDGLAKHYILSASGILTLISFAKLASLTSKYKFLYLADGLLGIPTWSLLLIASTMEIGVACALLLNIPTRNKLLLIFWLACTFSGYRISLWALDIPNTCRCLGDIPAFLHISPLTANLISLGIILYFISGSLVNLLRLR